VYTTAVMVSESSSGEASGRFAPRPSGRLLLGAPLSLTGRYALLGRLAAAGLWQVVGDIRGLGGVRVGAERLVPDLAVVDDESTREGVRRALDDLADADVLFGPYGSDLVEEAAGVAAERGRVLWNHGGAADHVQRLPGVVSVLSPAGAYAGPMLEALAELVPGARLLIAAGSGRFARSVVDGARRAAERLGMNVVGTVPHAEVPDDPTKQVDVLLAAGTFAEDLELLRRLQGQPSALAAVGAGIGRFGEELGSRAQGVVGPSQWEEGVRFRADVGPRGADVIRSLRAAVMARLRAEGTSGHVDYPTAQAYAAGLVAVRCVEQAGTTQDAAVRRVAREFRCTTFFGRFGLGQDGRQQDHQMLAVQWQDGVKRVVAPPSLAEASSGWADKSGRHRGGRSQGRRR
jgi:branched-chain amino acid transport system substrate-binding protein